MLGRRFSAEVILIIAQLAFGPILPPLSSAQDWGFRAKPRGELKVVDFLSPSISVLINYCEGLVLLDRDNNWVGGLAEDYRWIDERTIEFKLRQGVTFHDGEKFNAGAVKVNWEEYRKMGSPRPFSFYMLPDEMRFEIIDEYTVRFTFPQPEGLAFVKFFWFLQVAPAFFNEHRFDENNYGYFPEAGPWGTGPFKLVEGNLRFGKPSDRLVLEAYTDYWDRRYPRVRKVIFENSLIRDREKAMKLCRETEGHVDILSRIRPLDTQRIAESPFAKVIKSQDVGALYGFFNQRHKDSKWKDVRLRRAVNFGINREELWQYAAKGNAYNLGGFIPPGAYGYESSLSLYTYDTNKAKSLLEAAGYSKGFDLKIITTEAWKLEGQIISRMLERIGLKVQLDAVSYPEWLRKVFIPYLDKAPEEQDWDISLTNACDWFGHTGASFLTYWFLEENKMRWIEYDPVYEQMWKDVAMTLDRDLQEEKIRRMARYLYEQAYGLFIYSPLTLYAVNKEVDFVPQRSFFIRLKETSVTENHWSIEKRTTE